VDLWVEANCFQGFGELPGQLFFLHVSIRAFAFIAGAAIIDVLPFLDVPGHGASAGPAEDQSLERPWMFPDPGAGLPFEVEDFLDFLE
jgi:hypothetical protein